MRRIAEFLRQLAYRVRGERPDAALDEEMRLHLELRAEQARARGLDPDAARAEARRRFGNPGVLREEGRDAWGWAYLDGWLRDVREAGRTLLASPGFAATAVVSLALGIGANTAIFSLVDALLLRTLPVEDPQALVQIHMDQGQSFTNPLWEQVRDHADGFAGLLAFSSDQFDLAESGEVDLTDGMFVSGGYFRVLGVAPMLGRMLGPEDDRRGGGAEGAVAVISYRMWQGRYGGDEDVLGRRVLLDRAPFTIVGVMPPWFKGLENDRRYDVAIPIASEPLLHPDGSFLDRRSTWWLRVVGRLPKGGTIEQASDRLKAVSPDIFLATLPDWTAAGQAEYKARVLTPKPAATGFSFLGGVYREALYTLLGIAALVLLVACANIANLLLARGSQRERELSMRMALGAGRARLVRRLLCESLLLAFAGAAAGLAAAVVAGRALAAAIETRGAPLFTGYAPDPRVLAFAFAAALATVLLFGVAPAIRATRIKLNDVLKEGARGASQSGRRMWLGKALVGGQVALSLVLLGGAGLFVGTLQKLLDEPLGFDPSHVLTVEVDLEKAGVGRPQRVQLLESLLRELESIPGVASAAQTDRTPVSGMTWNQYILPEGASDRAMIYLNRVSAGYFKTLDTALLAGRDFAATDVVGAQPAIVIDEDAARAFWPGENPVGKTIAFGSDDREGQELFQVVGVVEAAKYERITEEPVHTGFVAAAQEENPGGRAAFVMRSSLAPEALEAAVKDAIASVHPGLSLRFQGLAQQVEASTLRHRLVATLSSVFAGLAVLLAVIGLYGVTAYTAARRRGEIGIRIALGAQPGSVVWLMVRDLAFVLGVGLAAGWAASLALGSMVESLLFGVEPGDPRLLGLAALILAAVSALAAYVPARRASKLQPIAVLREE